MPFPAVFAIEGTARHYDWGSPTAIPALLGTVPTGAPVAELWFGAHPDDPSAVPGEGRALDAVIDADPGRLLGAEVSAGYGRLPYLVKILAAARALSIQVHPTRRQAVEGFAAEDRAGVPRDAATRNYRDENHKPELIYALTTFEALCGFRPVEATLALFDQLACPELDPFRALLAGSGGLRAVFTALLETPEPGPLVEAVLRSTGLAGLDAGAARAISLAAGDVAGDIGVVLTLLLNYVRLEPGEAIYLGAGTVHAYLRGTGVEVMANSDNVLRCGLTSKHIDVAALLEITDFTPSPDPRFRGRTAAGAREFAPPVPDFALSVVELAGTGGGIDIGAIEVRAPGPRVVLCLAGLVRIEAGGDAVELSPGQAAFLPAGSEPSSSRIEAYRAIGTGRFCSISVGRQS